MFGILATSATGAVKERSGFSGLLLILIVAVLIFLVVLIVKKKKNGSMEVSNMVKGRRTIPAAKPITFLAFGFAVAIAVLFLFGLVDFAAWARSEKVDVSYVIDSVKNMTKDGYFQAMSKKIELYFKNVGDTKALGSALFATLSLVRNEIYALMFLVMFINLLFCWTPLTKAGKIGWGRASLRMGKKLRGIVGCALGYVVFQFVMYGRDVKLSGLGQTVLYAIVAFVALRVLLKHLASKDTIVHTIFSTVSSVAVAVFALLFFSKILVFPKEYGSLVEYMLGRLDFVMQALDADGAEKYLTMYIMVMISMLFILFAISVVKGALAKRVEGKKGISGAMIATLIWLVLAIALHYFGCKMLNDELKFSAWKKENKVLAEYMTQAVIYAAIGIGISIVTFILCKIGKEKDDEDVDEAEESEA